MTNQQILEKAISKAIDGGFNPGASENGEPPQQTFTRRMMQDLFFRHALIFNHDFAKALWGSFNNDIDQNMPRLTFQNPDKMPDRWQLHLQRMVIAEDLIAYLGKNI